jgi:hypothetical protein
MPVGAVASLLNHQRSPTLIVRVGTHALETGSQTTLWKRLSQHRGQARSGSGNHRGSIFRLIVGTALIHNAPGFPVSHARPSVV